MEFKSKRSNIIICSKTSNKRENEIKNIMNLYDPPNEVIRFYNGYPSMILDTIFINPENSKTAYHHILSLYLPDKTDLRRGAEYVALSILSICYILKCIKSHTITINLKY